MSFARDRPSGFASNQRSEVAQRLPMTGNGGVGSGEEHAQVLSYEQSALNLQGQPPDLGSLSHRTTLVAAAERALSRIAHVRGCGDEANMPAHQRHWPRRPLCGVGRSGEHAPIAFVAFRKGRDRRYLYGLYGSIFSPPRMHAPGVGTPPATKHALSSVLWLAWMSAATRFDSPCRRIPFASICA